jgi:hypothetical protein|tara:strand:- start:458 stop:616 length:159 start_codon:yes stop_codon:yes gene_type:complete
MGAHEVMGNVALYELRYGRKQRKKKKKEEEKRKVEYSNALTSLQSLCDNKKL